MTISSSKVAVWKRALARIGETAFPESEDEQTPAALVCGVLYDDLLREVLEARPWPWATRQRIVTNIDEQSIDYDGDDILEEFEVPYALVNTEQLVVELNEASAGFVEIDAGTDYTFTPAADGVNASITMTTPPATGDVLRLTVTTTRVGWDHVYVLPADCVTPTGFLYQDTRFDLVSPDSRVEFAVMLNDAGDGHLLCCDLSDDEFDALEYVATVDDVTAMPRYFVDAVAWRLAIELALAIKKDESMAVRFKGFYEQALDVASAYSQNLGHNSAEATTPSIAVRG